MKSFKAAIVIGALAGSAVLATAASADSQTFKIQSDYPYKVSLEFYSQDRSHVWPGNGKVYVIDDYDVHTYTLSCNTGEQICYGAWVRGNSDRYWGSGYDGQQRCSSCCLTCGHGDAAVFVLQR